jgi:hypothetical protein
LEPKKSTPHALLNPDGAAAERGIAEQLELRQTQAIDAGSAECFTVPCVKQLVGANGSHTLAP